MKVRMIHRVGKVVSWLESAPNPLEEMVEMCPIGRNMTILTGDPEIHTEGQKTVIYGQNDFVGRDGDVLSGCGRIYNMIVRGGQW
jgi:hypothetical protein